MDIREILDGDRVDLVTGLSFEEYCKIPAMNPSTLVHGRKSMLALKHAWDNPRPDTPALALGRAVHTMCFEPRTFGTLYTCWDGDRRTKAYKDFAADAYLRGLEVLKMEDWDACQKMGLAFVNDPRVRPFIAQGKPEVTVYGIDEGVQCRGRIDWVSTAENAIVDLKTTRSLSRRHHDFFSYHYDIKLALYQRWLGATRGLLPYVYVVWIEKAEPYDIAVDIVPPPILELGLAHALRILKQLPRCIETDTWPGETNGEITAIEAPHWVMEDDLDGAEEVEYGD